MSITSYELSSALQIVVADQPVLLSPGAATAIEDIWARENSSRSRPLFDGPLLSVVGLESQVILCRPASYKHFLAQLRQPTLYQDLGLRCLSVSGLLWMGEQIVFGRRSASVTQFPECWELVPSGSVTLRHLEADSPLAAALLEELEEETGIGPARCASLSPFVVVEDTDCFTVDVGLEIKLHDAHGMAGMASTDEYPSFSRVHPADVQDFCRQRPMVPASRALLEARGLLGAR